MKKVIVIVGPTGSGKTKLSIAVAKHLNAEIINGDAVQVYQGLDVGSAKIKPSEMAGIKHHLLDVCQPTENYNVFRFQKDVRQLIEQIDIPLIVGGTGLYMKAALYAYEFTEPGRDELFDQAYQDKNNQELYGLLKSLDPNIRIDVQNRRRMLRAIEQAKLGEPRSTKTKKDELLYNACILYLDLERSIQEERFRTRLEHQIKSGFIKEVQDLYEKGIRINAIGYRELVDYIEGFYTLEEAKERIIMASKKLAKKQKTWFKNQMNPMVLDAMSPSLLVDTLHVIDKFIKGE
ncbi:MAG: tRNA (adenosine(37)-N6)-dimethylallyltransferase MiaA [Acholeplasmataceae bacterium]|nr:tRNA (adenosine(37)-N6)-dimethylallyltransferase MiaA [Acholeplasmataceae bacterium]